jgi:hypothetical protein
VEYQQIRGRNMAGKKAKKIIEKKKKVIKKAKKAIKKAKKS